MPGSWTAGSTAELPVHQPLLPAETAAYSAQTDLIGRATRIDFSRGSAAGGPSGGSRPWYRNRSGVLKSRLPLPLVRFGVLKDARKPTAWP